MRTSVTHKLTVCKPSPVCLYIRESHRCYLVGISKQKCCINRYLCIMQYNAVQFILYQLTVSPLYIKD